MLLQRLGVLFGLDQSRAELAIPLDELLILSFEFASSIDRDFRFRFDSGMTP